MADHNNTNGVNASTSTSTTTNGDKKRVNFPSPPHHHRVSSITFESQGDLERLPIPTLEETLIKFPQVLSALQTPEQKQETLEIVKEFAQGDGPKLQALLEEYEADGLAGGSYVEEFWNDSYLAPDQSVVLNLNPFFVMEGSPDPKTAKEPILRAASLAFASIKLASRLKHETLAPDVFKGKPLDMDQFKALFGSCRLPCGDRDQVAVHPDSSHVVVLSHSQFYYFRALWPDGTVAVDEADIVDILGAIRSNSREASPLEAGKNALGVLTSLPRREWATARENIVASSPENAASLRIIDSALFVLVLDDDAPCDIHEAAANMLHGTYKLESNGGGVEYQTGTCCNRWYDKLQVIVCDDGTSGINFEHSAIDGHTALRFVSDVFAETIVNFAQSITRLIHGKGRIPHVVEAEVKRAANASDESGQPMLDVFPRKLVFDLPTSMTQQIYFAETALGDEIVASDTVVLEFKEYGKLLIVANNLSPDSFVQMSMLLAYYRLYGKIVCTYEPVLTKQFYHGRTEGMRTATPEAADFCRVWCNPFSTKNQKLEALRKATQEHSRLVKESASGKGVDRHLFALKCIAERNDVPVPPFFESPPWKMLNHTVLSTSNCGNPALRLFGFGPVVPDGFGIGYIIKDKGLQYSVSSKHRQTRRYVNTLQRTLLEIKELLNPINSMEVRGFQRQSLKMIKSKLENLEAYDDIWGEAAAPPISKMVVSPPKLDRLPSFSKYYRPVFERGSATPQELSYHGVPLEWIATEKDKEE